MYLADQVVPAQDGKPQETVKRAVKTLRGAASDNDRDEFVHEAEVCLVVAKMVRVC